jgi:hypothetical protein
MLRLYLLCSFCAVTSACCLHDFVMRLRTLAAMRLHRLVRARSGLQGPGCMQRNQGAYRRYVRDSLFLGDIDTGTCPSRLGESQELGQENMVFSPLGLRWRGPAATVNYRPVLSSERALQNNKPSTVSRKFQGERKIGRGSQMGA